MRRGCWKGREGGRAVYPPRSSTTVEEEEEEEEKEEGFKEQAVNELDAEREEQGQGP